LNEELKQLIENSDKPGGESADYLISPHDVLDISVLGEEELSLIVRVSEKGVISFPLLGGIQVAGFTSIELERELERKLEKDFLVSPSVNISIKEYSTISVLGQVKKPGSYEIKGRMTVTQAIAMAGGLTNIASANGTTVIRELNGEEKNIAVPLKDILGDGDLSRDIPLKPRDLIWVPESFF
jgi:polysaccharide export outer membrane protein